MTMQLDLHPNLQYLQSQHAPHCMGGRRSIGHKKRTTAKEAVILWKCMEATTGFEPVNNGFADHCLTAWLRRLSNVAAFYTTVDKFDKRKS